MADGASRCDRGGLRAGRGMVALVASGLLLVGAAGCSGEASDSVRLAQANVAAKEQALADAQTQQAQAEAAFCTSSATYITALDRYGDLLTQTAPTVGDVTDAGTDLTEPREDVMAAADDALAAREQVAVAEADLAAAQARLAQVEAADSSGTPTEPESSATPTEAASDSPAVSRVKQAEAEFAATQTGISAATPLREAAVQFNAAAVALEMAWLQLFAEAGCLTDAQQEQAASAVEEYTTTLQQSLTDAGYYDGDIDGVYGPQTVDAVQALQKANGLPQTGAVDKATAAALQAELADKGVATAQETTASTAALQQTLKLAGYWDGPVDGQWTDELTQALEELQTDLGVPATGEVDPATIAAFDKALAQATATPSPSLTPSQSPTRPAPEASPEAS